MNRMPLWAFLLILVIGILGTTAAAAMLYRTTQQLALASGAAGIHLPSVADLVAGNRGGGGAEDGSSTIASNSGASVDGQAEGPVGRASGSQPLHPTAVPIQVAAENHTAISGWDDPRRITILLMGVDLRTAVDEIPSPNTDSMILVTVDPLSQRAAVLSLPRDLWVAIPGFAHGRINTAYKIGESSNYPGGGAGLARDTVAQNLGIAVDYHVKVNFVAFEESIDAIFPRGVQICVQEEINDPDYPDVGYGTIEVHFPTGCQRMDGQRLLQYARTRATFDGDFGRSARQQQVLQAIQAEVFSLGGMVQLIWQLPALWNQLTAHFETNLQFQQIRDLLALLGELTAEDVVYDIVDERFVEFGVTASGEQVLIPRQDDLSNLAAHLLNPQETQTREELKTLAEGEAARVAVVNGAGLEGLAAAIGNHLSAHGLTIHTIGNATEQNQERTYIQHDGESLWTARYIAALFDWGAERLSQVAAGSITGDVAVVAGRDLQEFLHEFNQRSTGASG